jgi:hypothetical protein
MATTIDPREITELVERQIKPMLSKYLGGRPTEFQGAVLADLLAIWLAGHHVPDDVEASRKLRAELLAMHLEYVEALVNINAARMGVPHD